MAASAYKGLTIRIGADTTKLTSALRGIDSAAYKTQRELTKLGKAAQMDPKNSKLASAQLGAMMTQANNAAARLVKLNAAKKEALSQPATSQANAGKTIEDLAKETDNAALAAATATSRYNELNASIEPAYREVKKLTGIDLREMTNIGEFNQWFELVKDSGEVSEETVHKIESMKDAWMEARASMEDYGKVAALHDVTVDAQLAASQIRQMAKSMAELNTKSQFSKNFKDSVSQMGLLSAAADAVNHRISRLDESMRLDPTNMDVARERTKSLADALSIAERQSEILNKELNAYQSEGFEADASKLREEYGSLAEALQKTKSAYEASAPAVAGFKAELDDAQAALQHMKDTDDGSEESKRGIEEQTAAVAKLQEQYDKAAASHQKNTDAYDTAKACAEMENLKVRVMESNDQVVKLRNSFGGIEIRSGVSLRVNSLSSQMKVISAGAETAKTRFESLNNSMQLRPYSLGTAIDRVRAFREALDATRQRAQNLREQLDQYKSEGIDKIANSTKDAAVSFEQAQDKVNELNKQLAIAEKQFGEDSAEAKKLGEALRQAMLDANTAAAVNEYKDLQTQLRATEAEARSLKNSMKASFGEVGTAAVQAASQIGQLASQAGREVIDSSREIDAAYRDLRKTFDANESEYKELYDAAMEYSKTNVTSADTMLEMESIAAQLGVGLDEAGNKTANATEQIRKFAEVGANLDVATNIDADTIALQMGQIQNVMSDLSPDNIDSFGDALVRLGNTMPTQESNIMQITQRLSAVGDVAHFSTPQLMGWAAAIASTGQKSEAAATGISNIIAKISTAVAEGGDDIKKYSDVAGMSAEEFAEAWRTAPSDALRAVVQGVADSGDELFATLTDMDITSVRQTQTLASLSQTLDTVDGAIEKATDAWNGGGDAAAEAEKKAEGFSGAMQRMENDIQILAASFGEALVPGIEWLGEKLQWLIGVVDSWSDDTKSKVAIATGAFAAFATAEPIIAALGKNLVGLATGGISLVVNGFASLVVGTKATASILGSFVKAPTETAAALSSLGGAAGLAGKALALLASPLGIVAGAIAILGGALAIDYITKVNDAKKRSEEFDSTLRGISGTVEGLHADFLHGSSDVDSYGESWQAAGTDMDKFYEKMAGHIEAMNDLRGETSDTVGSLETYRDIIDNAIGAGDDWGGNISELQWALDGLANITGETYEAEDILAGKMDGEAGKADELRDAIDRLIDAKKKQSELDALTNMRTEAIQGQMEAKEAYEEAAEAYKNYRDIVMGAHGFTSGSELVSYVETSKNHDAEWLRDLESQWAESKAVYDEWGEKIAQIDREYESVYDRGAYINSDAYGTREGIIMTTEALTDAIAKYTDWGNTLDDMQPKVKEFSEEIRLAGVGSKEFEEMSADTFSSFLEQSGGDMEKLVGLVSDWNKQKLEEKYAIVEWDGQEAFETAEGVRYEWNGGEWVPAKLEVDASEVEGKTEETKDAVENTEAEMGIDGDNSEAIESVDEVKEHAENTEATVKVTADTGESPEVTTTTNSQVNVSVNAGDLVSLNKDLANIAKGAKVPVTTTVDKKQLTNLQGTLKDVAKTWEAKLDVTVNGTIAVNAILQTLRDADGRRYNTYYDIHRTTHEKTVKNARGGYVPGMTSIPKHADGFIATQPTLTQYGWIGEDGAEAYSGGSLVPLTNRKYSQPYIDDISDAVARKLGPTNAAPQVTVTVTGVSSPDEVADAIARKLTLLGL